ncbi:MAG: AAA family ATPase [Actinomycetota bacterium]|nr:AAA family ATPase [Actinomycetota bacterium]
MLEKLVVRNIALVADATLVFSPHLTVLSGETGAGKTALLFALRLLSGERSDSSMVRDGEGSASVEGTFALDDGRRLLAQRLIAASGRSRCMLDGRRCTVAELAQAVRPLLDLHGQHEQQVLLQTASHVRFLDAWIGEEALRARGAYEEAFDRHAAACAEHAALVRAASASIEQRELARLALQAIDAVNPSEGEYEELEAALPKLEHADALAQAASSALQVLRRDGGVEDALAEVSMELGRESGVDKRLDGFAEMAGDILVQVEELSSDLRAYRDSLEYDPQVLARYQDRLAALDGLCKRYGPGIEDVFARAADARRTLALAEEGNEALEESQARVGEAEKALVAAADALARVRGGRVDAFSDALTAATAALAMGGASFTMGVSDLPRSAWTREGTQHLELLYSPGAAVAPRPLARIASGGELSRVMLALISEVDVAAAGTLVFDEVDTGIGGSTATLVAEHLARLSATHQVIVVTHLAQVAVFADAQLLVEKTTAAGGMPVTGVRMLEGEERVAEIARMLSGDDGAVSLEHARALLASAEETKAH